VTGTDARFGTDLRLLRNLLQQSSRSPGSDLQTISRPAGLDLATLQGVENLQQALLLRFLTPVGALAPLGHPTYGCRLAELIGELNTETTRNRAKLYVLQALGEEPRVRQVVDVSVTQPAHPAPRDQVIIDVTLLAIAGDTPINLVFPFFLQGGVAR